MIDGLTIVAQRNEGDCGIACAAMLADVHYKVARAEAVKIDRNCEHAGLHRTQLVRLLERLNLDPVVKKKWDVGATGVLVLNPAKNPRKSGGHYVVLFEGVVIDPASACVWSLESYLAERTDYKALSLVEVTRRAQ